jgi:Mg2+ and Co2+ transporter CorA
MNNNENGIADFLASVAVLAILLAMVFGFFGLGLAISDWVLDGQYRNEMGLLTVIASIWLYEHRASRAHRESVDLQLQKLWEAVHK